MTAAIWFWRSSPVPLMTSPAEAAAAGVEEGTKSVDRQCRDSGANHARRQHRRRRSRHSQCRRRDHARRADDAARRAHWWAARARPPSIGGDEGTIRRPERSWFQLPPYGGIAGLNAACSTLPEGVAQASTPLRLFPSSLDVERNRLVG